MNSLLSRFLLYYVLRQTDCFPSKNCKILLDKGYLSEKSFSFYIYEVRHSSTSEHLIRIPYLLERAPGALM